MRLTKQRIRFVKVTVLLFIFICVCIFYLQRSNASFVQANTSEESFQSDQNTNIPLSAASNISFNHVIIDSTGPTNLWQKSVGDINGDGKTDLIAGGRNGGGLVWYENPNWTKHTITSGSNHSTDAEVADVDQDGDNDVISLTTTEIRWYENPDWTVHTIETRVLHDVEVADLDGDGDLDAVGRDQGEFGHQGNELHFYRQDSPTSWTHHVINIPSGEGLHLVDLDRDGDKDVVIGGNWYENTGSIVNGPWTQYTFTSTWTHGNAFIGSGDINGNGRFDIVLSPAELTGETYRISWFEAPLNPKNENWTEHIVENGVEAIHHFVGVADMNNDGDMDIATAEMHQGNDPDEVKVYINNGNGESWTKQVIATTGSHSMRIVDIDNDKDMDLYGANWQGQTVELWENLTCQSSLSNWERHVIDGSKPWQSVFVKSADINGDNQADIITGGWWYENPGNNGPSWTRHTIGSPLNNMAAVYDFDGDGDNDVLGTKGQGSQANASFVWAQNNGSGSFTILENIEAGDGDFLQGATTTHMENVNQLDIALSWHSANKGIQRLIIPDDPAVNTWTWSQISTVSQDEDLSADDIDRDGDNDLLLGTIWLRNDYPTWNSFNLSNNSGDPDRNKLADINGDGRLDAVIGYQAISTSGTLAWYEQGTTATDLWTEHVISNTIVGPMSLDVIDMDADGDPDIIVGEHNLSNPNSAKLVVFENMDGLGLNWTSHLVYEGDEHHDGARTIDIDLDGDLDIISIGWGHNRVILYENKHTCVPTNTQTPIPTGTHTPIPTGTHTPIPTSTHTPIPTSTHTPVPTSTHTPVPTSTHTPVPTSTHTPVPTSTHTPIPTNTHTPVPTNTHTPIPTNTHTPVPTNTHTPVPTNTHTPVPTSISTSIPQTSPTETTTPIPAQKTPTLPPPGSSGTTSFHIYIPLVTKNTSLNE